MIGSKKRDYLAYVGSKRNPNAYVGSKFRNADALIVQPSQAGGNQQQKSVLEKMTKTGHNLGQYA